MTIEEIRKGDERVANHKDKYGDYWDIVSDKEAYFKSDGKWVRYCFTDHMNHVKSGDIKPL